MSVSTIATQTTDNTTLFTLEKFEETLALYSHNLGIIKDSNQLASYISQEFSGLCKLYLKVGEEVKEKSLNAKSETLNIEVFLVNYFIPEHLKSVVILHRDVLLELTKAFLFSKEDMALEEHLSNHFKASKTVLASGIETLINEISNERKLLTTSKKTQKKIAENVLFYENPWTIYTDQFNEILEQLKEIHAVKGVLLSISDKFISLKKVVTKIDTKHKDLRVKLLENVDNLVRKVNDENSASDLTSFIDSELVHFETFGNNETVVTNELELYINTLDFIKIPISTNEGILNIREVQLKKAVQKWFDYHIVPSIMDLIAVEKSLKSKNHVTLTNLKSSIMISKENWKENFLEMFSNTVLNIKNEFLVSEKQSELIISKMHEGLNKELLIKNLFKARPFLDVAFNSSSLNRSKDTFFKKIQERIQQILLFLKKQRKKSEFEESYSQIELSIKCVAHRMYKEENEYYDTLFLNKNFIGDLFFVPRIHQEEKFKEALEQWNNGFNKSVLVHGDRLSGKSSFIDYTSKKYFNKDIVILKPNTVAIIDGRKFKTTYDLKEALFYVKNNNTKSTRPIVLIDDLEVWRDKTHKLLDNIRALAEFIATESDDAFVVATTSTIMKNHLDSVLNFSEGFSTSINTSSTYKEEIFEAIMLRHGAGQRVLVYESNELISTKKIKDSVYRLCKQYQNNLGDVLQAWTYSTYVKEGNQVLFKEENHEFRDFFSLKELIILKQALLFRHMSEYGLKQVAGEGYETDFKSSLKRLMNAKVLLREEVQGSLYINPVLLNDITGILDRKKYILK